MFTPKRDRGICLFLSLVLMALAFSSCASYFKRKECESTNWFDYGNKVAMQGKRLSGNEFIKQCEKAEAEIDYAALDQGFKKGMATYCLPETVYATGRKGERFAPDMCGGSNIRHLNERHAEGVRAYCDKSNGRSAGATGKPYNNICPKDLEKEFLVEFNAGRKSYLQANIVQNEREIDDIERAIQSLESRRRSLTLELHRVGDGKVITTERRYDPDTRTHREEVSIKADQATENRKDGLISDIRAIDSEISRKRKQQSNLREKNRALSAEAVAL